jgi:hypothetical protein
MQRGGQPFDNRGSASQPENDTPRFGCAALSHEKNEKDSIREQE